MSRGKLKVLLEWFSGNSKEDKKGVKLNSIE